MNLTLFDLDHTLLAGDSDYLWGRFLVDEGVVDAERYARENDLFHAQYLAGNLDIHAYQRFALAPLLAVPDRPRSCSVCSPSLYYRRSAAHGPSGLRLFARAGR